MILFFTSLLQICSDEKFMIAFFCTKNVDGVLHPLIFMVLISLFKQSIYIAKYMLSIYFQVNCCSIQITNNVSIIHFKKHK